MSLIIIINSNWLPSTQFWMLVLELITSLSGIYNFQTFLLFLTFLLNWWYNYPQNFYICLSFSNFRNIFPNSQSTSNSLVYWEVRLILNISVLFHVRRNWGNLFLPLYQRPQSLGSEKVQIESYYHSSHFCHS